MEKKAILKTCGWGPHYQVVCRALPDSVETGPDGTQRLKPHCFPGHASYIPMSVVTPFDAHHRLDAAIELEQEGYGPDSTWRNVVAGDYDVPAYVLKPECTDETARAIAIAITQNEVATHSSNALGTLHVVRLAKADRDKQGKSVKINDILSYLNSASNSEEAGTLISITEVEEALGLLESLSKRTDRSILVYDEVTLIAGRDQHAIYLKLVEVTKDIQGMQFDAEAGLLVTGLAGKCFLPDFKSGKKGRYDGSKGGWLPTGRKQKVFGKITPASEVMAVMRYAYAYWVVSGGNYLSKADYEQLITDQTWQSEQDQDMILLREEFTKCFDNETALSTPESRKRYAEHCLLAQVMEVLVMARKRTECHAVMEHWRLSNRTNVFTTSETCLHGFTTVIVTDHKNAAADEVIVVSAAKKVSAKKAKKVLVVPAESEVFTYY